MRPTSGNAAASASGTLDGAGVRASAGAHVIATARARSSDRLRSAGADEVVDHTTTSVAAAVTEPVDVLLNLAPITPEELTALAALVRPGGVVVNTTVWMQAPADEARGVRGVDVFVRSDAALLSRLVEMVDRGELRIDVAERVPLAELAAVHARAATGALRGKVVVLAPSPEAVVSFTLDPEVAEALAVGDVAARQEQSSCWLPAGPEPDAIASSGAAVLSIDRSALRPPANRGAWPS